MFSSFLVFLLQFPVLMLHPTGTEGFESKADNFKSLIAHQALDVLAIFGSISGFRGFWVMFQLYIMPGAAKRSTLDCVHDSKDSHIQ